MATIPSLLLLSFLPFLVPLKSEVNNPLGLLSHECNQILGNFTAGDTYDNNLKALFTKIYSDKVIDYGFYNFSYGQDPDKVKVIGLCRGDVKLEVCRSCLQSSAVLLRERCSEQKEAIGYNDACMIRYSNKSIFGVRETKTSQVYCNLKEAEASEVYNQKLQGLLDRLLNTAADGDSRRKFAEGDAAVLSSNETIHALVQCTPDLSKQSCSLCLSSALSSIPAAGCDGKKFSRYIGPSCYIRYDNSSLFYPIVDAPASQPSVVVPLPLRPPASANTTTSTQVPRKSRTPRTVIAVVILVVAIVVFIVIACIYPGARRPRHEYIEGY